MTRSTTIDLPFPLAALHAGKGSTWSDWQWRDGKTSLADWDPGAKPFSEGKKSDDKAAVEELAQEIDALQNLFFADGRYKMLLVLQGTDTAGKDGTVRGVFARTSPLGVHTVGWKAPTETERAHDFLWRIHQQAPGAGEIMVFNRSHYEDVLVPVVNGWITPEQTRERYEQINAFERLLAQSGTVVLKCLLHISKEEQRERLQDTDRRPGQALEIQHGRHRRAQAMGRLPACLRQRAARHQHRMGPLDRCAGRLQNPPQSHDRHPGARQPQGAETALPGARPGPGGLRVE